MPRLNKRQLREQRKLEELATQAREKTDEGESENDTQSDAEPSRATKSSAVGFAALGISGGGGGESDESEEETHKPVVAKKNKKKKKKSSNTSPIVEMTPKPQVKKSTKKGKEKEKARTDGVQADDIDKVLAELSLSTNGSSSQRTDLTSGPSSTLQNNLLAVSLPHLDNEAEMRKFFGSKVINTNKSQIKSPRGGRAAVQNIKSNLTKPQPTWWNASMREGLSMKQLSREEVEQKERRCDLSLKDTTDRWWTVEYSGRYRSVTKAFVSAVMIGDVDRFYGIMARLPWHADTLLQMSEVFRHQEDHAQSVDFLNRALFTYERAFIGSFTFASGENRLDFDQVENRPFFLAVSRMIADLQRRGCQRAAFEFGRLLLSLDPYTDPQGSLLYLDYLAVKAGMNDWLLSMWDLHDEVAKGASNDLGRKELAGSFNVTALPGWAYARALALHSKEDADKKSHENSTAALRDAVLSFPSIVPLIADKADIGLPGDVRALRSLTVYVDASQHTEESAILHLISHLYAHRSSSLWKIPEHAAWFRSTISTSTADLKSDDAKNQKLYKRFSTQFSSKTSSTLKRSICRHAFLLPDTNAARRLAAFFPPSISRGATSFSCDPMPPTTAVSQYDNEFFEGTEDIFKNRPRTRREQEQDARNMGRVVPDEQRRQLLMGLFEAHPQLQQLFPGGVVEFARRVAQLPDDVLNNLVVFEDGGLGFGQPGGREGAMPGGMGDMEERLMADFSDEEDEGVADEGGNDRRQQGDVANNDAEGGNVRGETGDVSGQDDGGDEGDDDSDDENNDVPIFPVRLVRGILNRLWGAPTEPNNPDEDSD